MANDARRCPQCGKPTSWHVASYDTAPDYTVTVLTVARLDDGTLQICSRVVMGGDEWRQR